MKKILGAVVAMCLSLSALATERVYSFGVSPQKSASELAQIWVPVLKRLSLASGVPLRFATARDSAEFAGRLKQGSYDFGYVNPHQYTLLHDNPGYEAMAREKGRSLKGLLVARKDGPVRTLADLEGQTLVFSSPTSFAASILPQAELRKQGIRFTPRYVGSHESVYLNVVKGLAPAGGGIASSLALSDEEVRSRLRVLWTTQGYTPHAIASHPRVPNAVRMKLLEAMLAMNDDPEARPLLEQIGFKGFQAAVDADWDNIRALNLQIED
jgi:phosphonate transport system substrate-binding protein